PRIATPCPSTTLFRSVAVAVEAEPDRVVLMPVRPDDQVRMRLRVDRAQRIPGVEARAAHDPHPRRLAVLIVLEQEARRIEVAALDRKSTRLNSSHVKI